MSNHAASGAIDHHHDHTTTTGIPNKKLFMWAFLASDCMFFGALISTHLIYRLHETPNQPDILGLFSLELTSFSTFILLMSSLLMALAVNACQKGHVPATRKMLLGTIVFGLIFLLCQVYEFSHFVHEKGLTLSSSMFGSTFYTLTGTHGCHVAIGVLWLVLMYIRTFKPADGSPWILKSIAHLAVFGIITVASIKAVLGGVHAIHEYGATATAVSAFVHHELIALLAAAASFVALYFFARSSKPVEFGEANAIDVEGMGLYWHFVDIVWIVIFTAVYLLEYL
ncbi:cytochrome c oxidase subunit 3 [Rariglobus hedericola]|uniref:Heme-copper oxidase subunit III n=1 Tax=Rariglobus hedericola TaxID=2597822 RepID=A0A556QM95_9BACT|nr:heme-copper oxidase subunit III [Rariglobus hedericola]TSJ77747.1 heme-copper oxidase subunit III [Rariglobus hedericola]